MKSLKIYIALFIALSQFVSIAITKKQTPKADSLADHFGTEPVKDVYGPHTTPSWNLRREGVGVGGKFTPITNYNQEINNKEVVNGDLTNASYDASKIISPNYASKIFFLFLLCLFISFLIFCFLLIFSLLYFISKFLKNI